MPGIIDVFANSRGNTFTWQPPERTNGVITGFIFKMFREGEENDATEIELGPFDFCYSPDSSTTPSGTGLVLSQVSSDRIMSKLSHFVTTLVTISLPRYNNWK